MTRVALALALSMALAACRADEDLSRAIAAGVGRGPTQPTVAAAAHQWIDIRSAQPGNDTIRMQPVAVCMQANRLVVADAGVNRLLMFAPDGRFLRSFGKPGSRPGEFVSLVLVRCERDTRVVLAADGGNGMLSAFDPDSGFLYRVKAPTSPQIGTLGEYAPAGGDRWYSSWLGSGVPIGPYLSDREWASVSLLDVRGPGGEIERSLGAPVSYHNPVARRVFNRTFLAAEPDTVWVLTQGDATVRGFTAQGMEMTPVRLPIYYRGREPDIDVGKPLGPGDGFRSNKLGYDPNVQDLAIAHDSLFATIRYRDWAYRLIGTGWDRTLAPTAESAIEVFDRRGHIRSAVTVPGFATELATNGRSRAAVLTRLRTRERRLLIGTLP